MRVDDIRLDVGVDGVHTELSGAVSMEKLDTEGLRIWFRAPSDLALHELDASPFLPGLLATAMWWGEDLEIDGPVSARLYEMVDQAMACYLNLYPHLHRIRVTAPTHVLTAGPHATACLFSRGVDSWYSVLTSLDRPNPGEAQVSHLVYVPSIDFMYGPENLDRSLDDTRRAAADIGCELVVLESNLRRFTERFQPWDVTFGGGLAGMALHLGEAFSHIRLAASFPLGAPTSFGSHPALDPLFSTERTQIVHSGATATRLDKVRYVAQVPVALGNLKVCYTEDTAHNCGTCGKCVMTMLELHVAGVRDLTELFDVPLEPPARACAVVQERRARRPPRRGARRARSARRPRQPTVAQCPAPSVPAQRGPSAGFATAPCRDGADAPPCRNLRDARLTRPGLSAERLLHRSARRAARRWCNTRDRRPARPRCPLRTCSGGRRPG